MKYYAVDSKARGQHWPRVIVIGGLVILLLLALTAFFVHKIYSDDLKPVGASQRRILVTVPSGATANQIAVKLKQQGLIKADWAFEWYIRNHNLRDKLEAGSYYISPNQDVASIVSLITEGKIATDLVTILPAQRIDQVRRALINAGFTTQDVEKALSPSSYPNNPALVDKPVGANLEGYLYPDSFQRAADTKATTIVAASLAEMAQRLTPDLRAGIEKQGLTVYQGIILASIVEQEVSKPSDRPIVAQVFFKRLQQGMPLGSDVTAFYGALLNNQTPSVTYDSVYNTRIHPGLPPGPISNVSQASLKAVANPAATDFLYFVAGDDGNTYFSHSLEEHQQLTQEHCKKLCGN